MQKRLAEKKAKVAAIKASHHKYVFKYCCARLHTQIICLGLPKTIIRASSHISSHATRLSYGTSCLDAILSALKPIADMTLLNGVDVTQGSGYSKQPISFKACLCAFKI